MARSYDECAPGHGLNRTTGSTKKRGGNKGIAAARKAQRRVEAEARNANTLPHNRRSARRVA